MLENYRAAQTAAPAFGKTLSVFAQWLGRGRLYRLPRQACSGVRTIQRLLTGGFRSQCKFTGQNRLNERSPARRELHHLLDLLLDVLGISAARLYCQYQ